MVERSDCLKINLSVPDRPPFSGHLKMGGVDPKGLEINANSRFLTLGGAPWLPVMGEFHFTRYPHLFWRDELLKMKAGGIQVVATYLFWIHHEEIEGRFDWTGDRDLRRFVALCAETGLYAYPRIGPWTHGEARNGGFPDWLVQKCGQQVRRDAPLYLDYARRFYTEIARQLEGLLWKDGGPVIGIQLENELADNPTHILTLKKLAREAGLDVPLYTMTGWGPAQVPVDEVLPVFGGYPDTFWDRQVESWSRASRKHYFFTPIRDDNAIGEDLLSRPDVADLSYLGRSPFATCELGGGMAIAYHRRALIEPDDVSAMAMVKVGCGNNAQGYYMYHGGTQPDGLLSTMQESQATGYWNDLPVKTYDFQAPIGEFGELSPSYASLRQLHLFLNDFGSRLAPMPMVLPECIPTGLDDRQTLRWAVRTDGQSGFLFINNYQRVEGLPEHPGVQFELNLKEETLKLPSHPVSIPSGGYSVWPFNLEIGGFRLRYATARLICRVMDGNVPCYVFSAEMGISPEFAFEPDESVTFEGELLRLANHGGMTRLHWDEPAARRWINLKRGAGQVARILVLGQAQGRMAWKATLWGRERFFISPAGLTFDGRQLRLTSTHPEELWFEVYPPIDGDLVSGDKRLNPTVVGQFVRFAVDQTPRAIPVSFHQVKPAGPVRKVAIGPLGVAQAPEEEAFEAAEAWEVCLPDGCLDGSYPGLKEVLLEINYVGDAARAYLDGRLIADHFYCGRPWRIGLKRFGPEAINRGLTLKFLPLSKDAPIYLDPEAWPDFVHDSEMVKLIGIKAAVVYAAVVCPAQNPSIEEK